MLFYNKDIRIKSAVIRFCSKFGYSPYSDITTNYRRFHIDEAQKIIFGHVISGDYKGEYLLTLEALVQAFAPKPKVLPKDWCVKIPNDKIGIKIRNLCLLVGYIQGTTSVKSEIKLVEVNKYGFVNCTKYQEIHGKLLTLEETFTLLKD